MRRTRNPLLPDCSQGERLVNVQLVKLIDISMEQHQRKPYRYSCSHRRFPKEAKRTTPNYLRVLIKMFWPRLFTRMEILNAIGGGLQLKLKLSGNRKIRFDSNRMPHTHARMCTVLLFSLSPSPSHAVCTFLLIRASFVVAFDSCNRLPETFGQWLIIFVG